MRRWHGTAGLRLQRKSRQADVKHIGRTTRSYGGMYLHQTAVALCGGPASAAWEARQRRQSHQRTPATCVWFAAQLGTSRSLQLDHACGLKPSGTFRLASPPQAPACIRGTHVHHYAIPEERLVSQHLAASCPPHNFHFFINSRLFRPPMVFKSGAIFI